MSDIKHLWELQKHEGNQVLFERKTKTIPEVKDLRILKSEIEEKQQAIQIIRNQTNVMKKELRIEEQDIVALKEKRAKMSEQLYSGEVSNVKELESTEKNVGTLSEKISASEEEAIIMMEKIEKKDAELNVLVNDLDNEKNRFRELNKVYIEKKEQTTKALEKIKSQIIKLTAKIGPQSMSRFTKLREKFDDKKGVAVLENGICSGCHMSVSFELLKQSKDKARELFCDNCGRLLVIE